MDLSAATREQMPRSAVLTEDDYKKALMLILILLQVAVHRTSSSVFKLVCESQM